MPFSFPKTLPKWSSILFIFIFSTSGLHAQNLVINELMALNRSTVHTASGAYADWIELYNGGSTPVDLTGYRLSDDGELASAWPCPQQTIDAGGFVLVWASGENGWVQGEMHTDFKLSSSGETLSLFHADGRLIDSITFPAQQADQSYARLPDGHVAWQLTASPTPGGANVADPPVEFEASDPSGLYSTPFDLTLHVNLPQAEIRYALGGDVPTASATLYTAPLRITQTTVMRAAVFVQGVQTGPIRTHTYFLNETPHLPVLALSAVPDDFFSETTGIYRHWDGQGSAWERPVHVELIEDNQPRFEISAGIRIHGNVSRNKDKKGLRLYFRCEYGMEALKYQLFPEQRPELDCFKRLVLYPPSGDDPTGSKYFTHVADVLTHSLYDEAGGDAAAFRPVSLYLNGAYWGIYWIRERIDRHYVNTHMGYEEMDLMRIIPEHHGAEFSEGDDRFWRETLDYFETQTFRVHSHYQYAAEHYFDVDNFIDYYIFNIFSGNDDWPQNNLDMVRDRSGADGRWRFIMWDTGSAWHYHGPDIPMLAWCTRNGLRTDIRSDWGDLLWSTVFFKRFLESAEFKRKFIIRYTDLMNTCLAPDSLIKRVDGLANWVRNEMPREEARWNYVHGGHWDEHLSRIYAFCAERRGFQRREIETALGVLRMANVTLQPSPGKGRLAINTLEPFSEPWTGRYFKPLPVEIRALPEPGFRFAGWTDPQLPDSVVIQVTPEHDLTFEAVFVADSVNRSVVINEINYNDAGDFQCQDWVELHNTSDDAADLSGWRFTVGDETVDLPEQTVLAAGGYLLLCRDGAAFHGCYDGQIIHAVELPIKLSNAGMHLALHCTAGLLVDSLTYSDDAPWPIEADGLGATLELIDAALDNGQASSWQAGQQYGTPGKANSGGWETGVEITNQADPQVFSLYPAYPNPFNGETIIVFSLNAPGPIALVVYNVLGRPVRRLQLGWTAAGVHRLSWHGCNDNGETVATGVYLIQLIAGKRRRLEKVVYTR